MQEITVACPRGDTTSLLNRLKGKVFHVTSSSAYRTIRETGKILHNKDRRFKLNTGSDNSFGRVMGYVCLFDLRNDHVSEAALSCYYFLGPQWFAQRRNGWIVTELAYLLLDPSCNDRVIPNSRMHDHYKATGKYLQFIPRAEVWMEDHVPLDWVDTVILTKLTKRAPAPNSLAGIVERLDRAVEVKE